MLSAHRVPPETPAQSRGADVGRGVSLGLSMCLRVRQGWMQTMPLPAGTPQCL